MSKKLKVLSNPCDKHKRLPSKGYLEAHFDAEMKLKTRSQWQIQCKGCGLWFWEKELR